MHETICDAAQAMTALDRSRHRGARRWLNRDKRLVGIVSLGDIAMAEGQGAAGEAITGVSRPGGPHSQTGAAA